MTDMTNQDFRTKDNVSAARRKFLATCGRFSIATPPAVALLLAASERNYAMALSGGGGGHGHGHHHGHHHHKHWGHGNNGYGNGGHDGVPGHSGHSDDRR